MSQVQRAYLHLLRNLASGQWPEGRRAPSLRQLAADLKMSTKPLATAVQMASRQGLLRVADRARPMVLPGADAQAQQLLAQMAEKRYLCRVAVLIPDEFFPLTGAPLHAELAQGVCQAIVHRGLDAEIVSIPQQEQVEFAQRTARLYDAGVVLSVKPEKLTALFTLRGLSMPLLLFNRQVPGLDIPTVNTDDYGAAVQLARILIGLGHRNLCMITLPFDEFISGRHTQTDGWLDALSEAGLVDRCTLPVAYFPRRGFVMTLDHVLRLTPPVTALVLGYPALFEQVTAEPRFHALRVPEQISLATMNSMHNVSRPPGFPPITSFEMNYRRIGELVAAHVERMLVGELSPPTVRLPLDIVRTDSIGRPPAEHGQPW